jgi:hypothetical protein
MAIPTAITTDIMEATTGAGIPITGKIKTLTPETTSNKQSNKKRNGKNKEEKPERKFLEVKVLRREASKVRVNTFKYEPA